MPAPGRSSWARWALVDNGSQSRWGSLKLSTVESKCPGRTGVLDSKRQLTSYCGEFRSREGFVWNFREPDPPRRPPILGFLDLKHQGEKKSVDQLPQVKMSAKDRSSCVQCQKPSRQTLMTSQTTQRELDLLAECWSLAPSERRCRVHNYWVQWELELDHSYEGGGPRKPVFSLYKWFVRNVSLATQVEVSAKDKSSWTTRWKRHRSPPSTPKKLKQLHRRSAGAGPSHWSLILSHRSHSCTYLKRKVSVRQPQVEMPQEQEFLGCACSERQEERVSIVSLGRNAGAWQEFLGPRGVGQGLSNCGRGE